MLLVTAVNVVIRVDLRLARRKEVWVRSFPKRPVTYLAVGMEHNLINYE